MRIMIYLGHPAHFHLFHHCLLEWREKGYLLQILVSRKDVLEDLLKAKGFDYVLVSEGKKHKNRFHLAWMVMKRGWQIFLQLRRFQADVMAGTAAEAPLMARLNGIPFINLNEDDADIVPLYAWLSYPFSDLILMPENCRAGRWKKKTLFYPGFHELAYLHPSQLQANTLAVSKNDIPGKPYILIRFSALTAHHDKGKKGLSENLAQEIIRLAGENYQVHISAEKMLSPALQAFQLRSDPQNIHRLMANAYLYIGDSQTMAAESAMLGVPFVRYNSFVGKLTYLAQLEDEYQLGYGFRPGEEAQMLQTIQKILYPQTVRTDWKKRRDAMLQGKINTARFLGWFIPHYPDSLREIGNKDFSWARFLEAPEENEEWILR